MIPVWPRPNHTLVWFAWSRPVNDTSFSERHMYYKNWLCSTCRLKSQLLANDTAIQSIPVFTTHCSPCSVDTHFYSAFKIICSTIQSYFTVRTATETDCQSWVESIHAPITNALLNSDVVLVLYSCSLLTQICMLIYQCTCMHAHTHTHTHTCKHMMYACTHACTHTHTRMPCMQALLHISYCPGQAPILMQAPTVWFWQFGHFSRSSVYRLPCKILVWWLESSQFELT